jgi:hypothetical protein
MDFRQVVNNKDSMKKILPVPYISQYSNSFDEDWKNRSCGIASIAMLLGFYNLDDSSPMNLVHEGIAIGGYCNNGWFHESLVRILRNHGVNAYAQEFRSVSVDYEQKTFSKNPFEQKMIDGGLSKIIKEIDGGHPVLISVKPGFNGNKENHLVLIIGYDFSDKKENFIIHDPNGNTENIENSEIEIEARKILEYWRNFAIFSYL